MLRNYKISSYSDNLSSLHFICVILLTFYICDSYNILSESPCFLIISQFAMAVSRKTYTKVTTVMVEPWWKIMGFRRRRSLCLFDNAWNQKAVSYLLLINFSIYNYWTLWLYRSRKYVGQKYLNSCSLRMTTRFLTVKENNKKRKTINFLLSSVFVITLKISLPLHFRFSRPVTWRGKDNEIGSEMKDTLKQNHVFWCYITLYLEENTSLCSQTVVRDHKRILQRINKCTFLPVWQKKQQLSALNLGMCVYRLHCSLVFIFLFLLYVFIVLYHCQ